MVLTDPRMIDAASTKASSTIAAAVGIANAVLLDNEACLTLLTRKIRRILFWNLDNNIVEVGIATSTTTAGAAGAAAGGGAALPIFVNLSNYGQFVWEPEKAEETVGRFRAVTGGVRRLAIYTVILSAAQVNGVRWVVDYYDDKGS